MRSFATETSYDSTPLGWASWWQQLRMVELLGKYSRDVWSLTYNGRAGRLREVLRDEPERARVSSPRDDTPLVLAAVALAASALPAWRATNADALIPLREV